MRIAMISRYLPSDSKMGVGFQVHALANALVRRGHAVTVFSQSPAADGAHYRLEQVMVRPPLRSLRASWYLRGVDWSRFDVLHAHGDDWFLWNKQVPPHVRTIHGSCLAEAANITGIKNKLYMLFLAGLETLSCVVADTTVAVSSNTCRSYPWIKTVIPNGVDVEAYAAPAGTAEKLGVRSWKLEAGDEGGFTTKTQRHEGRGDEVTGDRLQVTEGRKDPQIPQIPQITGLASQPAGRGSAAAGKNTECTDNTAITACTDEDSNSYLLTPNSCGKSAVPAILFVGTYGNRKRGKLLMEVFARDVLPKLPEAQLWMVCSDAPAAAGVCVLGRISQAELVDRYQRAWVFCLPSTYEGFGIPYIEAMAAGTAVVASPNVGAVEVTREGQDGLIAEDDKLGGALLQVLTDDVLRHNLEAAGRDRVKDFDLESVCERYEKIYAAAAARRHLASGI